MTPAIAIAKRVIDIAGASVGLAMTLPFYPLIAVAMRIDSPGPLFFKQRRAGMLLGPDPDHPDRPFRFVEFEMIKFRTMVPDAEKHTGAVLARKSDPRITRLGRIMRKMRIDELPQFWNVLRGDMSIVGPRSTFQN